MLTEHMNMPEIIQISMRLFGLYFVAIACTFDHRLPAVSFFIEIILARKERRVRKMGARGETTVPTRSYSDQHQISSCIVNTYSTPGVMRIKDMIT